MDVSVLTSSAGKNRGRRWAWASSRTLTYAQHTHLWRTEPGQKHSVLQSPTQRLSQVHQKLNLGRSDEAV